MAIEDKSSRELKVWLGKFLTLWVWPQKRFLLHASPWLHAHVRKLGGRLWRTISLPLCRPFHFPSERTVMYPPSSVPPSSIFSPPPHLPFLAFHPLNNPILPYTVYTILLYSSPGWITYSRLDVSSQEVMLSLEGAVHKPSVKRRVATDISGGVCRLFFLFDRSSWSSSRMFSSRYTEGLRVKTVNCNKRRMDGCQQFFNMNNTPGSILAQSILT